jgi:hypothetical protein
MSVVSTQPEMVTSVLSTSKRLLDRGLADYPRDGAGMDGSGRIERRRNGGSGDSPMDVLTRLPAVVVLERLPVASLALARDGIPETFHTVPRRRPRSHCVETSDRISEPA